MVSSIHPFVVRHVGVLFQPHGNKIGAVMKFCEEMKEKESLIL